MLARLRTPHHLAITHIAPTLATAGVLILGAGLAAPAAAEPDGDPAGHNGSIKIEYVGDDDQTPENNPKQPCTLNVEWYGLDEGDIDSQVSFELMSPTPDAELSVDGPTEVAVGEDPAGGGTDLDAAVTYLFGIEGEPGPQGYHLRVEVRTPGAKGLEYKTKVFWVESCASTPTESEAPIAPAPDTPETTPDATPDATPTEPEPDASAGPTPQVMGTSLTQAAPDAPRPAADAPNPVAEAAPDAPLRGDGAVDLVDAGIQQAADRPEGSTPVMLPLFGALLVAAGVLISATRRHRGARRD